MRQNMHFVFFALAVMRITGFGATTRFFAAGFFGALFFTGAIGHSRV